MTAGGDLANQIWMETKCKDLIKDHPIVEIEADMPIAQACEVHAAKILI